MAGNPGEEEKEEEVKEEEKLKMSWLLTFYALSTGTVISKRLFVDWFLTVPAPCKVLLRDGSVQIIERAVAPRQRQQSKLVFLTESQYTDT